MSLRARAAGLHRFRDEVSADGGKRRLVRRVRRIVRDTDRREFHRYIGHPSRSTD
ncbi:hypothetical protein [Streptomyces sp. NPDC058268]|uniref:hypothetical protein n=1 Tax=Streptomyces sp. NPDC058268 TaxID=3346413 RepID=UPI0036E8F5B3